MESGIIIQLQEIFGNTLQNFFQNTSSIEWGIIAAMLSAALLLFKINGISQILFKVGGIILLILIIFILADVIKL